MRTKPGRWRWRLVGCWAAMTPSTPAAPPEQPPRLVVVAGPETLLAERAVVGLVAAVRALERSEGVPDDQRAVVTRLDAAEVSPANADAVGIDELLSPSLFGERRVVVLQGAQDLPEQVSEQVRSHLSNLADDVMLVLVHKGGLKGRKLLDAATKSGAHVISCPAIKYDRDKVAFVQRLAREARPRRSLTPEAVRALVNALGQDLVELAAGVEQLLTVTDGDIEESTVDLYHGGRVESSGFKVADAAVEGRAGDALVLLRHGLSLGLAPVLVTSAMAASLRAIARVAGASRGLRREDLAGDLGIAPFQVDKARRQVPSWSAQGVARAITAVAQADAAVKGGGTDPWYAVERAVVAVAGYRDRG